MLICIVLLMLQRKEVNRPMVQRHYYVDKMGFVHQIETEENERPSTDEVQNLAEENQAYTAN